ncbi:MAG: hypothetical protein VW683_17345 [Betaproteobacteria bacterium]
MVDWYQEVSGVKTVERNEFFPPGYKEVSSTYRISFSPYDFEKDLQKIVSLVRSELTEDLLSPKWKKRPRRGLEGFCVVGTRTIECLLNTDSTPYRGPLGDDWHWWLQVGDRIIDVVFDGNGEYDHSSGSRTGWYGWKGQIQKRSITLLKRVLKSDGRRYHEETIPSVSSQLPI